MITVYDKCTAGTKRKKTKDGYLIVKDNKLARPGILTYLAGELDFPGKNPMDIVRIYRPPQLVFDEEVIDSFRSKPVTINHPPESVTAANYRDMAVGISKDDVRKEDDFMVGSIVVTDCEAVKQIEDGTLEISLGYQADCDYRPGQSNYGAYDGQFTKMTGNHIALVRKGRCGSSCRVSDAKTNNGVKEMSTVTHDGISYELSAQGAELVAKLQGQINKMSDEKQSLVVDHALEVSAKEKEVKDSLQKEIDKLQAQLDDAKSRIVTDEQIAEKVEDRCKLIETVKTLVSDFDATGKTDDQIKAEVVKIKRNVDVSDKSVDYIQASFDALLEGSDTYKQAFESHGKKQVIKDEDTRPAWQIAREKRIEENKTKWRGE